MGNLESVHSSSTNLAAQLIISSLSKYCVGMSDLVIAKLNQYVVQSTLPCFSFVLYVSSRLRLQQQVITRAY